MLKLQSNTNYSKDLNWTILIKTGFLFCFESVSVWSVDSDLVVQGDLQNWKKTV